jgi:hypothetical protein
LENNKVEKAMNTQLMAKRYEAPKKYCQLPCASP